MPSGFDQRLADFMERKWMPSREALVGYLRKLGVQRVAMESGLPAAQLQKLLDDATNPSWLLRTVSPEVFCLGLAATSARPAEISSLHDLEPLLDGRFPEEFRIEVPAVDEDWNQGQAPSCGGWAASVAMGSTIEQADSQPGFLANPSYIYSCAQLLSGNSSHGTTLPLLAEAVATHGAIPWGAGPIFRDVEDDNPGNLPIPAEQLEAGEENRTATVHWTDWRESSAPAILAVLSSNFRRGPSRCLPVVTGAPVFDSLFNPYTAETGVVLEPAPDEIPLGGHAFAVIGWRQINGRRYWVAKNSWGPGFGAGGLLFFPDLYAQKYFHPGFVVHTLVREEVSSARPALLSVAGFASCAAFLAIVAFVTVAAVVLAALAWPWLRSRSTSHGFGFGQAAIVSPSSLESPPDPGRRELVKKRSSVVSEQKLPPVVFPPAAVDPIAGYLAISRRIDRFLEQPDTGHLSGAWSR